MKNILLHNRIQVIVFFVLGLFFCPPTHAQTDPTVAWAQQFGGVFTRGGDVTTDVFGNIYMTGHFSGTTDFGSFTLTSAGSSDVFVVKINTSGTVLWAERFGGWGEDFGRNITVDALGNVYTTGTFNNIATFGSITLTTTTGRSIFVVKQDALGTVLWVKEFVSEWTPEIYGFTATGIATDTQGNIYTTGYFGGETSTFGNITLTRSSVSTTVSNKPSDTFVVKQNASGQVLWAENFGSTSNHGLVRSSGLSTDTFGNIYITGIFQGTANFGDITLINSSIDGTNVGVVFVTKMDASGEVLWAKSFSEEGNNFSSYSNDIFFDTSDNVYIIGNFKGEMTVGTYTLASIYNQQDDSFSPKLFIMKIDSSGEGLWAGAYGSTSVPGGSIVTDTSGNMYVTGHFTEIIDFGDITLTSEGFSDVFLLKINSSGVIEWVDRFGSTGSDGGTIIAIDAAEDIYIAGNFSDTVDFGGTTLTAANSGEIFLMKISSNSSLIVVPNQSTQWRVYPNPTKDIITIQFSEYGTEATVEIFNLIGQKVMDYGSIIGTQTLDISRLTQGVYMLKINNDLIKVKKQ